MSIPISTCESGFSSQMERQLRKCISSLLLKEKSFFTDIQAKIEFHFNRSLTPKEYRALNEIVYILNNNYIYYLIIELCSMTMNYLKITMQIKIIPVKPA